MTLQFQKSYPRGGTSSLLARAVGGPVCSAPGRLLESGSGVSAPAAFRGVV